KAMAKELAVPVVALCQLNREPEGRTDNRPRLADLRESGSLEMDADVVVLMSRAAREPNVIELSIAKNRNGPVGDVKLVYCAQWTRFENYASGLPPFGGREVIVPLPHDQRADFVGAAQSGRGLPDERPVVDDFAGVMEGVQRPVGADARD